MPANKTLEAICNTEVKLNCFGNLWRHVEFLRSSPAFQGEYPDMFWCWELEHVGAVLTRLLANNPDTAPIRSQHHLDINNTNEFAKSHEPSFTIVFRCRKESKYFLVTEITKYLESLHFRVAVDIYHGADDANT